MKEHISAGESLGDNVLIEAYLAAVSPPSPRRFTLHLSISTWNLQNYFNVILVSRPLQRHWETKLNVPPTNPFASQLQTEVGLYIANSLATATVSGSNRARRGCLLSENWSHINTSTHVKRIWKTECLWVLHRCKSQLQKVILRKLPQSTFCVLKFVFRKTKCVCVRMYTHTHSNRLDKREGLIWTDYCDQMGLTEFDWNVKLIAKLCSSSVCVRILWRIYGALPDGQASTPTAVIWYSPYRRVGESHGRGGQIPSNRVARKEKRARDKHKSPEWRFLSKRINYILQF